VARTASSISSKSAKRFCVRKCGKTKAFPAKVGSGFASGNAEDKKHFQQKCEAVLRPVKPTPKTVLTILSEQEQG